MQKMTINLLMTVLAASLLACGGPRFQMTPTHTEKTASGKPIRDTLVIVVIDDEEVRAIFENHFKEWLAAKGVEAIISTDVLPVQKKTQLEKETIVEAIDKHENDSVLITQLVGLEESEVFSRGLPQYHRSYYGYYKYAWGYVSWPTITSENIQISLETRLYDVSTEALRWAGYSRLTNPETTGKAVSQVVEAVMVELEKNGLLPDAS